MSDIVYKKFGFSTPFLQGYDELRIPIMDSAGKTAWPEVFPIGKIKELRRTVGQRYFSSQMMLQYIAPDKAKFDPDAMHPYSEDFDIHTAKIGESLMTGACVYWDPSLAGKNSDCSVSVLIYRDDKNQHIYLHDILYLTVAENDLHPLAGQCEKVLDFMLYHHIRRIVIETNGIGNALPEIMHDVANKRNATITVQKQVNTQNKETRILDAIEPVLCTGRLHANKRVWETPFIAEMLDWSPIGSSIHDDGLDALSGAICAVPIPIHPLGQIIRSFRANTDFKI